MFLLFILKHQGLFILFKDKEIIHKKGIYNYVLLMKKMDWIVIEGRLSL
jgi:hypothetical protein